jgi:hypothetical protein
MPKRTIEKENVDYYLVCYDSAGHERREEDGTLLSETLRTHFTTTAGITDVFVISHGWKGDIPAAITQYDSWVSVMVDQTADRQAAVRACPAFKAVVVGIHWPSLPWGDEGMADAGLLGLGPDGDVDEFLAESSLDLDSLVERYAARIAATPTARNALRTILTADLDPATLTRDSTAVDLPPVVQEAYQTLLTESGLGHGGEAAAPGADQQGLPAARIIASSIDNLVVEPPTEPARPDDGEPGLLGDGGAGGGFRHKLRNILLMPVRQLSFWSMKNRARQVGETGVHDLLLSLQEAAREARFHLMGHSFGCIVVSAALAGPRGADDGAAAPAGMRPAASLFLVQGALSLWAFADTVPFGLNLPGYFHGVRADNLVSGPVVTTRSSHDRAVGFFYPLGASLDDELLLADVLPAFGGIGAFGICGLAAPSPVDLPVLGADGQYDMQRGLVYNIEASSVICAGAGFSGAHSDIVHPQIAHLLWSAAVAAM